MVNTDLVPSSAQDFGYVDLFVKAIKLIFGAEYISCPEIYLSLALSRKRSKDLS